MTEITPDQHRMETAARSVAAKLRAFHDGLTPDEQQALDIALRPVGARGTATSEDATGYFISAVQLPLIAVKIVEQLRRQSAQGTQQR